MKATFQLIKRSFKNKLIFQIQARQGTLRTSLLALGALTLSRAPVYCQNPDEFNPGASSTVYALAVEADGCILAGGSFGQLGGQSRGRVGRLYADGTLDPYFNPIASSYVYCLAVQKDGRIVVGGRFTRLANARRNCVGRLNAHGTLDAAFNPGAGGGTSVNV